MLKNKFLSLSLFFLFTFSASFIGVIATKNFKEPWYSSLIKPSFNPPDWLFAPVWTTLYLMMTIAIWLFWLSKNRDQKTIFYYFIHIAVNTTWSIVFFVYHQILLAIVVLILLIVMIAFIMLSFKRVNMTSFYLMTPYLLWCFYALVLNISLYMLN